MKYFLKNLFENSKEIHDPMIYFVCAKGQTWIKQVSQVTQCGMHGLQRRNIYSDRTNNVSHTMSRQARATNVASVKLHLTRPPCSMLISTRQVVDLYLCSGKKTGRPVKFLKMCHKILFCTPSLPLDGNVSQPRLCILMSPCVSRVTS